MYLFNVEGKIDTLAYVNEKVKKINSTCVLIKINNKRCAIKYVQNHPPAL